VRIAIVGPAFPYKGGGAHHTTELAHRLAGAGHDVVIESWRAQYPSFLYPGQQTIDAPEGEPFPRTRRDLAWYRPDGWLRTGRRLRSADLVVLAVLTPVQVPSYLGILRGVGGRARAVALCHNVLPHERKPYDVPLMNLFRALEPLPNHGLTSDGRHLTPPITHPADLSAANLSQGYPLRNLLTLQALDAVWREISG